MRKSTFKSTKCATSRCNVDVIRNLLNQCVVIVVIELYITVRSKSQGGTQRPLGGGGSVAAAAGQSWNRKVCRGRTASQSCRAGLGACMSWVGRWQSTELPVIAIEQNLRDPLAQ